MEPKQNKKNRLPAFELTLRIKQEALRIGFSQVGITEPKNFSKAEQRIASWVRRGKHAGMKYLEKFSERSGRFMEAFGRARSVIVLGVNYFTKTKSPSESPPSFLQGQMTRYAWGKDYHEIIRAKHEELIRSLKDSLGADFRARSCVDIQPIPERFAAVQAGLGFIGKHTGLLSSKFGPWLFLSEIITDLELRPDTPARGGCGVCTRCQTACPTGALSRDYELDARRCLAYLTIEHKGVIARELRSRIGHRVFGCDECLSRCPFNAKSKETLWDEFHPGEGAGEWLDFEKLFSLKTNSAYEKEFRGTALVRVSRKQMLRNACVVLGNSGDARAVPYLEKALEDIAPLVRLHAVWALGQIKTDKAQRILHDHSRRETNREVQDELADVLQP